MKRTDMNQVWEKFRNYHANHDLTRMRLRDIPSELQDAVKTYLAALSEQLTDPDNESFSVIDPNERHNALLAVKMKFSQLPVCARRTSASF